MKKTFSIILIVTFIFMLTFPLISYPLLKKHDNLQLEENRALAEFPEFGDTFGSDFDKFFNDHIPFRNNYIKFYMDFEESLNSAYEKLMDKLNLPYYVIQKYVLFGEDDWLFYTGEQALENYQGVDLPSSAELAQFMDNIDRLDKLFASKNIPISYMAIPNKERAYQKYMPQSLEVVSSVSRAEMVIDYIQQNSNIKIIYPKSVLMGETEKLTYYKYDTHWNKYGAFLGMNEYLKSIGETQLTATFEQVDRQGGDLAEMINKQHELVDIDYIATYTNSVQSDENLVLIGDSFRTALSEHILKVYPNAKIFHHDEYDKYLYNGVLENADRVIYEWVERYTNISLGYRVNMILSHLS